MTSHRYLRRSLCCALLALVPLLCVASTRAQPARQPPSDPRSIALFIVVDTSGSMGGSDGADPQELRWTAVKLLVSLLSPGDRVSVLAFSSANPEKQRDAVRLFHVTTPGGQVGPLIQIGQDADQKLVLDQLQRFQQSNPPVGETDMRAAFKSVASLLPSGSSSGKPYVIFLTDGEPSVPSDESPADYRKELVDGVRALKVPVYAGGLWKDANCNNLDAAEANKQRLLEDLAFPLGRASCIDDASDIAPFFLKSFGDVAYRAYTTSSQGSYSISQEQEEVIESATFIFVSSVGGCNIRTGAGLCTSVRDRDGSVLTPDNLANHGARVLSDDRFLAITIDTPKAGEWQLGGEQDWHIIQRTSVRMDVDAVVDQTIVTRQPDNQPLTIRARFWRDDGVAETPLVNTRPVFVQQSIAALTPADEPPATFTLSPDGSEFRGGIPAIGRVDTYIVRVSATLAGFTFNEERLVKIEAFPIYVAEGIPEGGTLPVRQGQQATIRVKPQTAGTTVQDVDGLTSDQLTLLCEGQIIPTTWAGSAGSYVLSFPPPDRPQSVCSVSLEGTLTHQGTPYRITQNPIVGFTLATQPVLDVQAQTSQFDLKPMLPSHEREMTGISATLFALEPARVWATLDGTDALTVSVEPQNLRQNAPTALRIVLRTTSAVQPADDTVYQGIIKLHTDSSVKLEGQTQFGYQVTLQPPTVTHELGARYKLKEPVIGLEQLEIPLELDGNLTQASPLSVTVSDASGALISGIEPVLTPEDASIAPSGRTRFVLRLESASGAEPWPIFWLDPSPISFRVRLAAGQAVQIQPQPDVLVEGVRMSRLEAFQTRYARPIAVTRNSIILALLLGIASWAFLLWAWVRATRRQAVPAQGYLVPVSIAQGKTTPAYNDPISLASLYGGLKQQLFGIRLHSQNTSPRGPLNIRLWPPQAVWSIFVGAHKQDGSLPTSEALAVRLRPQQSGSAQSMYAIENLHPTPLVLIKGRLKTTIQRGDTHGFNQGDIIITGDDAETGDELGLMLHGESNLPASSQRTRNGTASSEGSWSAEDRQQGSRRAESANRPESSWSDAPDPSVSAGYGSRRQTADGADAGAVSSVLGNTQPSASGRWAVADRPGADHDDAPRSGSSRRQ